MFQVILTGFDPAQGLIGPEVESSNKTCETKAELEDLLTQYLEAEIKDPQFDPRVVIQGEGEDVEIRRDGSKLFLYDRNNPNRQGIEVGPGLFSSAPESQETEKQEEEDEPIQLSKDRSGSRVWILILVSVLVTGGIQAAIFLNSQNNLYTEADFSTVSSSKAGNFIETWNGFFVGGFEDQRLGIHIRSDSTFVVYSSNDLGPWEVLETGKFDVVSSGSSQGFQFDTGVFVGLVESGNLDYYGIPLNKMPVPGDLTLES